MNRKKTQGRSTYVKKAEMAVRAGMITATKLFFGVSREAAEWAVNVLLNLLNPSNNTTHVAALETTTEFIATTLSRKEPVPMIMLRAFIAIPSEFLLTPAYQKYREDVEHFVRFQGMVLAFSGGSVAAANSLCTTFLTRFAYERDQRRYYEVSPALSEKLQHTEIRGVPAASVKLPFHTICIAHKHTLGGREYDYLFVTEALLQIIEDGKAIPYWTLVSYQGTLRYNHGPVYTSECSLGWEGATTEDTIASLDGESFQKLTSWLINLVLYITSYPTEIEYEPVTQEARSLLKKLQGETGKKRGRLQKKFNSLSPEYRLHVGRRVTKDLVESSTEGRKVQVRTLVTGHWRNQACGLNRKDRKLIWIEPHWRGPELAPATQPTRVVT